MSSDAVPHVTVRLYGGLDWFASDADRAGVVEVPLGGPRSVKDLVESVGVPHVEVGRLVIDGRTVGFGEVIADSGRVAVYPVSATMDDDQLRPPPPRPIRFVADVHLGVLARRLRALGFDTWWDRDADDDVLADRAVGDDRVLLSRDRGLLMRRIVVHGYCPRSDDPDEQVTEVLRHYDLYGEAAPFTRCVTCNGVLDRVAKETVIDSLPPRTRLEHDDFVRCVRCGQVFWPGSHHAAMRSWVREVLHPDG